jgi:putative aldouronate transport system substrate-binding protein
MLMPSGSEVCQSMEHGSGAVMKKKYLIIIAAVLAVIIAGGTTAYLLLNRGVQETDEEDFLPDAWKVDPEKLERVNLTIYINAQKQNIYDEIMEDVNLKLDNDLKTTVTFKFLWIYYEQFMDRLRTDNASGITYDALIYNNVLNTPVKVFADEGLAMDVKDLFPEYAPNYYNQFTPEDLKSLQVNGGIYVIPARMPSADLKYALVRQNLMEKYNIPAIKSYDDYEVFLETVKQNEPGIVPMCYRNTSMGLFANMYGYVPLDYITGLVYKLDDPSMKIMAWEQIPEFRECIDRMMRWFRNGYLDDGGEKSGYLGTPNGDFTENYDPLVISETAASFIADPSDESYFNTLLQSKGITDYYYKAYPLYDGNITRDSLMENGVMINPLTRHPERVLMFIDWLQSDQENYDLLMYGKKDVHYIDRGNYIEPPDDAVTTFMEWTWKKPFENISYQRAYYPGMKEGMEDYQKLISDRAKYPPHYGFAPDYSSVDSIYRNRWMQYSVPEDYAYYGGDDVDEDNLEVFLKMFYDEQEEMGIDALIAEVQNQLDEYMTKYVR